MVLKSETITIGGVIFNAEDVVKALSVRCKTYQPEEVIEDEQII
jgi:hypothetical protein